MLINDQLAFLESKALTMSSEDDKKALLAVARQLRAGQRLFRDSDREVISRRGFAGVLRAREEWLANQADK